MNPMRHTAYVKAVLKQLAHRRDVSAYVESQLRMALDELEVLDAKMEHLTGRFVIDGERPLVCAMRHDFGLASKGMYCMHRSHGRGATRDRDRERKIRWPGEYEEER